MNSPEEHGNGPVVHDHRRIDPVTGQVREPDRPRGKHAASQPGGRTRPEDASHRSGQGAEPDGSAPGPRPEPPARSGAGQAAEAQPDRSSGTGEGKEMATLKEQLAERTADLQRLQAEYANYRKRVDRDRATVREQAVASALSELLPVLDAIGQAREHGELSGGFKSVADSLQAAVTKLGLVSYGQRGDAFDPKIHEALTHTYSPDVDEDTCVEIFQPGYKVGERILRPARVAVAAPTTGPDDSGEAAGWPSGEENN